MTAVLTIMFILTALFGVSAVLALVWAMKTGQFSNFADGATSIFDDEEPLGTTTDEFPPPPEREPNACAQADPSTNDPRTEE